MGKLGSLPFFFEAIEHAYLCKLFGNVSDGITAILPNREDGLIWNDLGFAEDSILNRVLVVIKSIRSPIVLIFSTKDLIPDGILFASEHILRD